MIAPQNSNDTGVVFESANGEQTVKKTIAFSMGKVMKWLALGIGITGVLAIALSDLFVYLLGSGRLSADTFSTRGSASTFKNLSAIPKPTPKRAPNPNITIIA